MVKKNSIFKCYVALKFTLLHVSEVEYFFRDQEHAQLPRRVASPILKLHKIKKYCWIHNEKLNLVVFFKKISDHHSFWKNDTKSYSKSRKFVQSEMCTRWPLQIVT